MKFYNYLAKGLNYNEKQFLRGDLFVSDINA